MATSTCAKCGGTIFTVKEKEPANSNFVLQFVECSSCGTVVGVLNFYDIGSLILDQNRALQAIARAIGVEGFPKLTGTQ